MAFMMRQFDRLAPIGATAMEILLRLGSPTVDAAQNTMLEDRIKLLETTCQDVVRDLSDSDQMESLKDAAKLLKSAKYVAHVVSTFCVVFRELHARSDALSNTELTDLLSRIQTELNPAIDDMIVALRRTYEAVTTNWVRAESEAVKQGLDAVSRVGQEIQTIAINAAIEAARVGPAGRGFAVISQEIRGLSHASETSLADLNRLLAAGGLGDRT